MSESDLVEFLRARLDEDEEISQACVWAGRPAEWHVAVAGVASAGSMVIWDTDIIPDQRHDVIHHVARHDPARVLREVEAKRRILAWASDPKMNPELIPEAERYYVLTALASSYADHSDYREKWRL